MKRKWLVGILAIVMATSFGVTACGGTGDDGSGSGNSNSSEISSSEVVDGSSSEENSSSEVVDGSSLEENSSVVEDNSSEIMDSSSEVMDSSSEEIIDSSSEGVEDSSSEDKYPEDYYTEGLAFALQDDDTYAVTDYTGTAAEVVIPSVYNNLPVKSIDQGVFFGCGILTEISIPKSLTSIGVGPFIFCQSLTNITVQKNNPEYISIDGNLYSKDGKNLVQYAVGKTATTFTIPNGVTSIGEGAFFGCSSLTEIIIPDGVTSIGEAAFRYCSNLTKIVIPDSVTSISDEETFDDCDNLQYTIKGGLKYLGNPNNPYIYLAGTETTDITSATIETTCKFIGEYAFRYCNSLTEIEIPNSVTSIGDEVFIFCYNLTKVVIPDSVTSIGDKIFESCSNLQCTIKDGLKYLGNPNNPYIYLVGMEMTDITSATIEPTCKFIGCQVFAWRDGLTEIVIPDSVTSIDERAFFMCSSLTRVTIGKGVTSISSEAFSNCNSLKEITVDRDNKVYKDIDGNLYTKDGTTLIQYAIGKTATSFTILDSVTRIGRAAFKDCGNLTKIVIPKTVMKMGDDVFSGCYNLTIYCEMESEPQAWDGLDWNISRCPVVWGYKGE